MAECSDLLYVDKVSVTFPVPGGRLQAVKSFSMAIRPGKVTALVGESGSGKSVLGRSIMGVESPLADIGGRAIFNDPEGEGPVDLLGLPRDGRQIRRIRGRRIGMIFQEPMTSFSPVHSIGNQIEDVLKVHEVLSSKERRERIEEMLAQVGFHEPGRVFDMYPFELSGGMRQRAMIAMALICRPALLIADEPTTALDVTIQAQILKLLKDLQEKLNMAILLVTHDLGVVASMADDVVVIYRGEVMEAGPVGAIFRDAAHPYTKGLMAAVPHFDLNRNERLQPLREIHVDTTRLIGACRSIPGKEGGASGALLSLRHVSKSFRPKASNGFFSKPVAPVRAVHDVSFDIMRGETLGLVGESGCGKTTLSKILMRGLTADSGSVIFDRGEGPVDVLAAQGETLQNLRTTIQMVFQDPVSSLSPRMTVRGLIGEPLDIHGRGTRAERLEAVRRLLHAIGLPETALGRYPHSFSGGQRQRIGIARALALGPDLMILDEPVSALDVSVQAQILNLMKDLKRELGLTYLFISHNLAVVNYMADRVAVMYAGRIVEIAPCDVIMRNPVHPYTKKLLAAVPVPSLDHPMDFMVMGEPSREAKKRWARQFSDEGDPDTLTHADLGGGHLVLARRTVDARELVA
ncbi:ABC transporter ATP-binding protein [Allorhizobium sp. BGMRC 0089]|uniref:dipeptide ABC transporter ATP-binding protein n=1 Tax=Allorhizobium sonneratiae TaxID=2934936 RepID=UPI002033BE32|nr:ABC transporter ATP-binding protein [Allorhizobium sonneratiae]MCM2290717.1 ABC transporter ATP-binding protein [Allorhizobium sonneratiae]